MIPLFVERIREFENIERIKNKLTIYEATLHSNIVSNSKNGSSIHRGFLKENNNQILQLNLRDQYDNYMFSQTTIFDRFKKKTTKL